ncbi:MAG: hypothetical protein ACPGD5_05550 [Salibacteraceae bacterium]
MEITSEYSSWFIILCAALAGLYTFILYRKNSQLNELPSWVVYLLSGLRFFTVFFISILLINPLIQKWIVQTEEPVVIVAQDISESILNNGDSVFYKRTYPQKWNDLVAGISKNYKVVSMPFGSEVLPPNSAIEFTQKRTNYSQLFDEIDAKYAGDNIAAVVIASDGLYNVGANPKYYNFKQVYPIYTIGLGDSTQKSDIAIVETLSNDIVYLENDFLVRVGVKAQLLNSKQAELVVKNNGKVVEKRKLKIESNNQYFTEEFIFNANEVGTQRYTFSVTEFKNELNIVNNTGFILIDVIDNQDRVLILADAPHPDISTIRRSLATKDNIQVEVALVTNMDKVYEAYSLIIAHGFGSNAHMNIWEKLWQSKVPLFAVVKGDGNLNALNELGIGFHLNGGKGKPNNVTGMVNTNFSGFKNTEEVIKFIEDCPPVISPFGQIEGYQETQVLLMQKLGSIVTEYPLCYFGNRDGIKTGWFYGEGLWKWRMFDYQQNESFNNFDEFTGKIAQYLSVKEDKSRFRVSSKRRFNETENVRVIAELYNPSYELINEDEVKLRVTNQNNEDFNFVFNPIGNTYAIDLGRLKAGVYNYVGTTVSKGEKFTKTGTIVVNPINVEWEKMSADFSVLESLSKFTKGKFYNVNEMDNLRSEFNDKDKFPAVTYSSEVKQLLLHEKWIFFLILTLISVEWFTRKFKGRY